MELRRDRHIRADKGGEYKDDAHQNLKQFRFDSPFNQDPDHFHLSWDIICCNCAVGNAPPDGLFRAKFMRMPCIAPMARA